MWTKKKLLENKGFTLLEVMIAIAILAVALGAILAIEGGSIVATERAKRLNIVAMLAKNQMVEMEFKIRGKSFDEAKKEEQGKFENPYQEYQWKSSIKELKFPNFAPPQKEKSESGGGESQMASMIGKLMTNHLSKAVREVTVTVSWKQNNKDQAYSLSTYWVNLNHEFAMSE